MAQDGQQRPANNWPCVAGRAVDPAYLETSESTGGQLFLFQKDEVAHSGVVMSAGYTHPQTIARAVGHLSGERELTFPVDSTVESLLVLVSLQCPRSIATISPGGLERTSANSVRTDLKAGQILKIDNPAFGEWKIRLAGTGLFVVSVLAKSAIRLGPVRFSEGGSDGRKAIQTTISGEVFNVRLHLVDAGGGAVTDDYPMEAAGSGAYRTVVSAPVERFRVVLSGTDASGRPVQRTDPILFRAKR